MLKTIRDMAIGAIICFAAVFAATSFGAVGVPPGTGPALVDGTWLNGLAGGLNYSYQYGITAAGTTQATATALPAGVRLVEVDTTAASTGVNLPPCIPGTAVSLYNNGASTLTIYPAVANNPLIAAATQDTINSGTSFSGGVATHVAFFAFCTKAGVWAAK